MPKAVYWTVLAQVFYSALIFGYVTNISVVIQADNLGSATEAGMAISVLHLVPYLQALCLEGLSICCQECICLLGF